MEVPGDSANAAFIRKHAAPDRIGLCGGRDWINKITRKAQAPLTGDGHRSPWSHTFLFSEQRIYDSVLPHQTHPMIRDLGISSLHRLAHGSSELLNTPVEELF